MLFSLMNEVVRMTQERGFETFLASRGRLAGCLDDIASLLGGIPGGSERAKRLVNARESLLLDAFRLMVVGEFKRGKSTLVNSLLGKEVLPARVAPCTALITEVQYAENPRAILHYKDPAEKPVTVAIEDLRKYVVIDDSGEAEDIPESQIGQSRYSHMELYYPLPLCKNNVQIVDSPGLNEHKTRTQVALDFLSKADALIMVLSCQQALSQSELAFIDGELGGRNLSHVFFIWNHFDAIADSPDDVEDIRRRSAKYLEARVGSKARVFYVSARDGLRAKKLNDTHSLERSGVQRLEVCLEQFLATDRGRVKLLTPLRVAEVAVREAVTELIPRAEAMLARPLEDLLKAYEEQRPRLEDAERQRERLIRSIERRREALIREAGASYKRFVSETEIEIRDEVAKIDVGKWDVIARRQATQQEIGEQLQAWLGYRSKAWQEGDLAALLESHAKDLESDIEGQASDFLATITKVRHALAPSASAVEAEEDVPSSDRLFAAVGGLFLGGVGSAIEGASMGFKGMASGVALNMGVGLGLAVAGFGLPVVLPILATIGIARTMIGAQKTVDRMRLQVANGLVGELRANSPSAIAQMTSLISGPFNNLRDAIDAALRIQIDEISGQVQAILKKKQQGEDHMRWELGRLKAAREALVATGKELDIIRNDIDVPEEA